MKKNILPLLLVMLSTVAGAQNFDKFFENKTLRMDYTHAGNATEEYYFFEKLIEEPYFAGSKNSLIDNFNFGNQYLKVYDIATGELIYSRGFSVLFTEWQSTDEAKVTNRSYSESVVMPYPKNSVRIEIYSRDKKCEFVKKFEHTVDPASPFIAKTRNLLPTYDVLYNGSPAHKLDVVLISEGYSVDEFEKFQKDCDNFVEKFFSYSPYKERKEDFNIRGVWAPSKERGVTIPGDNVWKKSVLDSKFYTFGSERYIMVDNFQKVRDVAANAPYELIYILANTPKYGGGAIFNFYAISITDHPKSTGDVYAHEFGHLLVGLGDEYEGDTALSEMYPEGVEPWELNLSRLVDFEKNKPYWSSLIPKSQPIPTPKTEEYNGKIGVYEGGGYVNKGIHRPRMNCMMRAYGEGVFCPVCTKGINDMIDFICK